MECAQSAITFIVSSAHRLLAAKWLSANPLRCVQAAQRPLGLGLDTYKPNTLAGCGATPALTVCTAWPTWAMYPRSGAHYREIYKTNKPLPPASTAQGAIEFIVNRSLIASPMTSLNHLARRAQAVPALARSAGAASSLRPERLPCSMRLTAAHFSCRAVGRETPWGADGLPRRSEGLRSSPSLAGWAGAHTW